MNQHPHYALIDAANVVNILYHFWGIGHMANGKNATVPSLLVDKVRQKLNVIRRYCLPESSFVLVLDEHSTRKKEVYPQYKQNHRGYYVPVREVVAELAEEDSKLKVCVSRGNEADDTIATLCDRNVQGYTTIVSCDQDLWQLLSPTVRIFSPIQKTFLEPTQIALKYGQGLGAAHVPLAKALWGDSGDNIPISIGRSRKKLLPLVVKSDGSLDHFMDLVKQAWEDLDENLRLHWMLGEDQLRRNYQLVLLDRNCEIIWDREALTE